MSTYTIDNLPDEALPALDELTGDLRLLAERFGVRLALQISALFDSTPARLYGHDRWVRKWRDKQMRAEYDRGGISIVALARKFGVSERHAYNILGLEPGEDKQMRLF